MAVDIEALARNQKTLIGVVDALNKEVATLKKRDAEKSSLIEKLHERTKKLENPNQDFHDMINKALRKK